MVRITEELVRKKSEHNEGIIGTLEELSLHQEDVEKIENLNNWCKNLQILYLQANVIPKIENLNKLKQLEYLNLALNNIEKIENLERCEFLNKLDLTLNFIGDLESVCSLKHNIHLKHLYLTGNPCTDFPGYRQYVIANLPQLATLDGAEISRSERIKAQQVVDQLLPGIRKAQEEHRIKREKQKEDALINNQDHLSNEEFWKAESPHTPETRISISKRNQENRKLKDAKKEEKPKKTIRLLNKDGRPLNINEAKLNFILNDEDPDKITLDIEIYKHLDSNLITVDLQPIYVTVTVKGKIFQFVFSEEIQVDKSTAKRSEITGHLLLEMPRVKHNSILFRLKERIEQEKAEKLEKHSKTTQGNKSGRNSKYLEVMENSDMDYTKIVENNEKLKNGFDDNPEVPALEYGVFF